MDASAWIALATLAFAVVVQAGVMAFMMGGLFARVRTVESRPADTDCKAELAVLSSRFAAMEDLVKELGHDIKNLLTGRVVPARRRRGGEE